MRKELRKLLPGGKFANVSAVTSKTMAAIKGRGAHSTERMLRMGLVRTGVSGWKQNLGDISGKPDFFFPHASLAVFVDGCFWHGCPKCGHIPKTNQAFWEAKIKRNKKHDRTVSKALRSSGIYVLRFWEHEVRADIKKCISLITKQLQSEPKT